MAPTAILATQHLENYKKMFNQFGIKCELLISAITKKKKQELLERLESGEIDILIGTHAIIEENVKFKNLGLVVTDEQHRFGVKQRTKIVEKGQNPDVLVMTATLTGENGILTRVQSTKTQNEKKTIEEQIHLALQSSRINEGLIIDKAILEEELSNNEMEIIKSDNNELPWTIRKNSYLYMINKNGELEEKLHLQLHRLLYLLQTALEILTRH